MISRDKSFPNSPRGNIDDTLRFIFILPVIFLYFLVMSITLKAIFIGVNWVYLKPEGFGSIAKALLSGLRFDIAILMYLFLPAILFYCAALLLRRNAMYRIITGYFILLTLFIQVFWLADIQYFEEAGKHFTYEAFAYIGSSSLPVISGAFKLHPWLSTLSILSSIIFCFITGRVIQWCHRTFISPVHIRTFPCTFTLIAFLSVAVVGSRGGVQHVPINIGDSVISASPYLNAVCLNPVFSAFRATFSSSKQLQFFDDEFNIRNVRSLLNIKPEQPASSRYPLLRYSSGTRRGNRKNIILFVLESWTGKDIGCLGSKLGLTPFFDDLSRHGVLFTNFYATGIRTSEGIFSILCSFPNQPLTPIMKKQEIYQTRWRSLSQILAEAGYSNIFIHGRDLDFDRMQQFLKFVGFQKIIDRHDFPPSVSRIADASWPGYHDEDVMRRADEEFSKQSGHPFFGIIYTMNTHPPFVTPEDFPKSFPSTTISNRFLNSLRYSDHALGTFFHIAGERPYFKDTIFIFVSDHTRTRDNFNFSNQHHIPMLIYSPGYVRPGIDPVVGSQLDLLPTILGLLQLRTAHSSWGRNLLELPQNGGFAVSVAGNEVRWHNSHYLLNDSLTNTPLLFDITRDPDCTTDIWPENRQTGEILKTRSRSYISLSQTLLYQNRVSP